MNATIKVTKKAESNHVANIINGITPDAYGYEGSTVEDAIAGLRRRYDRLNASLPVTVCDIDGITVVRQFNA